MVSNPEGFIQAFDFTGYWLPVNRKKFQAESEKRARPSHDSFVLLMTPLPPPTATISAASAEAAVASTLA